MADQHLTQDVIGTVDLEADRFKPGLTGVSEPALHDMCSPAEGRQIPVTEVDGGLRCTVGVSPASACHMIPSTGSTPGGSMGRCGVLLQAKGLPVVLSIAEALPDETPGRGNRHGAGGDDRHRRPFLWTFGVDGCFWVCRHPDGGSAGS
jgi:hypothetical protein